MNGPILVILLLVFVVCGFVGYFVAEGRGKGGPGFALGFFFGPIGIVAAALLEPTPEIQAQRDGRLAAALAGAVRSVLNAPGDTSPARVREPDTAQPSHPANSGDASVRLDYLEEAVRRRGHSKDLSDPEVLRELSREVDLIEREEAIRSSLVLLDERKRHDAARVRLQESADAAPLSRSDAVVLVRFKIGFTTDYEDLSVSSVTRGSPAEVAGIRVGDVIKIAWGVPVTTFAQLAASARAALSMPGARLDLTVKRDGRSVTLEQVALSAAAP